MIIHNGDQAQFEIDNANVSLEQRADWPLPSFDARDWAKEFCKIAKGLGHQIDEGWMVSWFANALMRGFDERASKVDTYCPKCSCKKCMDRWMTSIKEARR